MKIINITLLTIVIVLFFFSCQKELFFDGISTGVLKKDLFGNCHPVIINGTYKVDSAFSKENFIEVQVVVSIPGTYDIMTDTVNGYFFHQNGNIKKGISTIRLYPNGKAKDTGSNCFTVKYGSSVCDFCIKTLGLQPAKYILTGAPNICAGIFTDGTYTIGKALTASNILTVQTNVSIPGTYALTATTNNGFSFTGSGVFTATGVQNIILKGIGIPIKAEVSNVTVSNIESTCNFGINVLSDTAGKAIFNFDGSPNDCLNFTIKGTYYAGIVTNANNTITLSVNVTKPGSYSINTNTANGITFSSSGTFINTGQQTVILLAKGKPVLSGLTAFVPNTGTVSCNYYINVAALPPPAIFNLSGAPNACSPVTVNGFYIVSKILDAANTIIIQVDVSIAGSYSITTNTVNGISFSDSGVFTTTGLQNVILQGKGIPAVTGTSVLTVLNGTSNCTFNVPVI